MTRSDTVFAGGVPDLYDRLMVPLFFAPYAAEVPPRLPALRTGHVLETAAGTGAVTAALAGALPAEVAITATDLNPPMLDRARARLAGTRVALREADAQALPFEDGSFDAVICQFGVMFMPDKAKAHAEAWRVLKPGGRLLFSAWSALDRNPVPALVQRAVAAQFATDPPLFMARTPHGYHDIPAMTAVVEAAGFAEVHAERVGLLGRGTAREAAMAICRGTPLSNEILARGAPGLDAVTEAAVRALAEGLGGLAPDAPFEAPMEAIFVSATKPR